MPPSTSTLAAPWTTCRDRDRTTTAITAGGHVPPPPRWPRRVAGLALVLVVFALGIALGQALNDGPPPPSTGTYVRTLTSR